MADKTNIEQRIRQAQDLKASLEEKWILEIYELFFRFYFAIAVNLAPVDSG